MKEGETMKHEDNLIPPFVSGHSRAQWVIFFLMAGIMLGVIALTSTYCQIALLSKVMAGQAITQAEAVANDTRQQIIGLLQVAIFLGTAIFFLMWIYRAHRNLRALGARDLKYSPGWAVGGFLVPFLNLVRPFQVVKEIWKGSEPETMPMRLDPSYQSTKRSAIVGWWWASVLLSTFVGNVVARMAFRAGETLSALLSMSWAMLVSDVLDIPAGVLAILIVKKIDAMQENKRKLLTRF